MHVLINVLQVIWLEEYLQTWDNTLIVVSHARDFLNSICTDTLHLHDQQLKRYAAHHCHEYPRLVGDYSTH